MPGGARAIGTVAEPRADSVGADPAPRDVVRRVRGSWNQSSPIFLRVRAEDGDDAAAEQGDPPQRALERVLVQLPLEDAHVGDRGEPPLARLGLALGTVPIS